MRLARGAVSNAKILRPFAVSPRTRVDQTCPSVLMSASSCVSISDGAMNGMLPSTTDSPSPNASVMSTSLVSGTLVAFSSGIGSQPPERLMKPPNWIYQPPNSLSVCT